MRYLVFVTILFVSQALALEWPPDPGDIEDFDDRTAELSK